MKYWFFAVLFANVVLLLWEFHSGAFESQSNAAIENEPKQILLLSEIPAGGASGKSGDTLAQSDAPGPVSQPGAPDSETSVAPAPSSVTAEPDVVPAVGAGSPGASGNEVDALAASSLESAAPLGASVEQAKPEATYTACYTTGRVQDVAALQALVDQYKPQLFALEATIKEMRQRGSYLVYYPPAATLEEAANTAAKLRSDFGIRDLLVIREGELKGAISLGIFGSERRAKTAQSQFEKKGLSVRLGPLHPPELYYAVQMQWNDQQKRAADEFSKTLKTRFPPLRRVSRCIPLAKPPSLPALQTAVPDTGPEAANSAGTSASIEPPPAERQESWAANTPPVPSSTQPPQAKAISTQDQERPEAGQNEAVSTACFTTGRVQETAALQGLLEQYRPQLSALEATAHETYKDGRYLVYYPPAATLEESAAIAAKLRSEFGIRDLLVIRQGTLKGAVSLGTFRSEQRAKTAQSQYEKKGLSVRVGPLYPPEVHYSVRIQWNNQQQQSADELSKTLKTRFPPLRRTDSCAALAADPQAAEKPPAAPANQGATGAADAKSVVPEETTAASDSGSATAHPNSPPPEAEAVSLDTQMSTFAQPKAAKIEVEHVACYMTGSVDNPAKMQALVEQYRPQLLALEAVSEERRKSESYFVYYPIAKTMVEAQANAEMLRNNYGIKDLLVVREGELKGAVSLGFFSSEQRAKTAQSQLEQKGVHAEIRPRYPLEVRYLLKIRWNDRQAEAAAKLTEALKSRFTPLKTAASCGG